MIWKEYVVFYLQQLSTGNFLFGYWYIPFIMVTFLMAPLHLRFARLRPNLQWCTLLLLLVISSLIHRPVQKMFTLHSVIYYLPLYLLGIMCSQRKEKIWAFCCGREVLLAIPFLVLAAYQAWLYNTSGNYQDDTLTMTIDLNLWQKVFLCLFFMVFLHRFEHSRTRLLDLIASASFAIYFLHPFVMQLFKRLDYRLNVPDGYLTYTILVSLIIMTSVAIGYAAKRLLGSKSRFLIGW
jgi:peptidoglycan/LPS O-acetylase OafA/YrhL